MSWIKDFMSRLFGERKSAEEWLPFHCKRLSIVDIAEKESVAGDAFASLAPPRPFGGKDQGFKIGDAAPAASHFEQGSHDGTDHVPQEAVGRDTEVPVIVAALAAGQGQVRRRIAVPAGLGNRADGGLGVGAGLLETAEIMLSEEGLRGFVHRREIHFREGVEPGIGVHERIFDPVQEISVFPARGIEPRRGHVAPPHTI